MSFSPGIKHTENVERVQTADMTTEQVIAGAQSELNRSEAGTGALPSMKDIGAADGHVVKTNIVGPGTEGA